MKFVDDWINEKKAENPIQARYDVGVTSGFFGLVINLILFAIKLVAGSISGAISIIADAMNNLSDSASSLLTILAFKYAAKPADEDHPYGHQRAETVATLLVAILIVFVGLQFMTSSVGRIFNPEPIHSSGLVIFLLIISIVSKLLMGIFYRFVSVKLSSGMIMAVAKDSFNDVLMTSVVVVSYLVEIYFQVTIDGIVGLAIAIFIIVDGIKSIIETINELLGMRPSDEEIENMQAILDQYPHLIGYHDLRVHSYGPHKTYATVDIEIDSRSSLEEAHYIMDEIEREFLERLNVKLVSHLDPVRIQDSRHNSLHGQLKDIIKSNPSFSSFHDFRIHLVDGREVLAFDVVVKQDVSLTDEELFDELAQAIYDKIGNYQLDIDFDRIYLLSEKEKNHD